MIIAIATTFLCINQVEQSGFAELQGQVVNLSELYFYDHHNKFL